MTESEEKAYIAGQQQAWRQLLALASRELGVTGETKERLVCERAETIQLLREVCAEYGDNDWPDDLHLRDVIEKHLYRHLATDARPAKKPASPHTEAPSVPFHARKLGRPWERLVPLIRELFRVTGNACCWHVVLDDCNPECFASCRERSLVCAEESCHALGVATEGVSFLSLFRANHARDLEQEAERDRLYRQREGRDPPRVARRGETIILTSDTVFADIEEGAIIKTNGFRLTVLSGNMVDVAEATRAR